MQKAGSLERPSRASPSYERLKGPFDPSETPLRAIYITPCPGTRHRPR